MEGIQKAQLCPRHNLEHIFWKRHALLFFLNWMGGLQFMGDEEDNVGCCLFDFKARETVQITLFYSYTQNLHTVFKNVHRKVSNF